MGRKAATTIPISLAVNQPDASDQFAHAPIFESLGDSELSRISVSRLEPVEEGFLGNVAPDVTEAQIKSKWGGGKYQLRGYTANGTYAKGAQRTVSISGDPIFESKAAELRWKKQTGMAEEKGNDNHQVGPAPLSFAEMMALAEKNAEKARAEAERKAEQARADAEAQHKREIERLRFEAETREKERKADEERRERERLEDIERREKEARDRDERMRREHEEARQRDREFQTMMLQIVQSSNKSGDSTKALLTGMELMQKIGNAGGGGDEASPVTALINNLPSIIENGKQFIAAGGAVAPAAAAAAHPNPAPAAPAAASGAPEVTLEGKLGAKAMAAAEHLKQLGADPELAFERLFDQLLTLRPAAAPPASPPTSSPAPAPAAPPAASEGAPAKATTRRKSATTKR